MSQTHLYTFTWEHTDGMTERQSGTGMNAAWHWSVQPDEGGWSNIGQNLNTDTQNAQLDAAYFFVDFKSWKYNIMIDNEW